jgi:NAD(P) transhydrogenase subunit alpha
VLQKKTLSMGSIGQVLLFLFAATLVLLLSVADRPAHASSQQADSETSSESTGSGGGEQPGGDKERAKKQADEGVESDSRGKVMLASLTIFVLAIFVGFEIITKVPPTLHTPLMSGSNAISGITIVGAVIVAGHKGGAPWLGMMAVSLAMVNVVGGFLVTHRMLSMFVKPMRKRGSE